MKSQILTAVMLASVASSAVFGSAFAADTVTQQSADTWRASKLVGISIYGPDRKSVGKIDDVIMSKDGKAQLIIIGVGGFLGVGEKDIAVPYDQVKFSNEAIGQSSASSSTGATRSDPATVANGDGSSTVGQPMTNRSASSSGKEGSYPDHGSIDMTADQLKSAPSFKFAS